MAVRSLRKIPVFVWIPPIYGALYKIEITRPNGTTDDITDIIYEGEIIDGVTDTIGNFTFTLDNSNETYTDVWTGNEVIKIYIDYETTATTSRFRGRIEKVSYQDNKIKITGRSESKRLLDVTVTKEYTTTETSVILKALFDAYATDFTYTNVNTFSTSVSVSWYQKPFWECVQDLCHSAGFDAYIDPDLDCHFFESGTVNNVNECIIHGSNLFEVSDFAYDQSLIKNRVIVYGAEVEGQPVIYTSDDETSQNDYGIKELIIQDQNIATTTQAQEKADFELSISKDPPLVGDVKSIGLATIQPGEKIRISAPYSNLIPNYYKIISYRHEFRGLMTTTLTIEKEPRKIYHLMKDRISQEQKLKDMPNPNEMRYSWIFDFDTDSGSHSTTEITGGVLKVSTGSTGTWVSANNEITNNATACELRVTGEALPGTLYYVSADNGNTWQLITPRTSLNFSPAGKYLKIKVELNSASTQIDSLSLLYKT